MRYRRGVPVGLVALSLCGIATGFASSRFSTAPHQQVPVDRLIQNLTSLVAEEPENTSARYALGRAYATIVAHRTSEVRGYYYVPTAEERAGGRPVSASVEMEHRQTDLKPDPDLTAEEIGLHASKAITYMRQVVHESPEDPRVWLTYAYLLSNVQDVLANMPEFYLVHGLCCGDEETIQRYIDYFLDDGELTQSEIERIESELRDSGRDQWIEPLWSDGSEVAFVACQRMCRSGILNENRLGTMRDMVRTHVREMALRYYFKAASLAFEPEITGRRQRIWGIHNVITADAAASFIAFGDKWGMFGEDDPRKALAQEMFEKTDGLPPQGITPIIFSLNAPAPLESLLAPETVVHFDLDGTGREQSWPWVSPEASILVWDPEETGEVTSGRQLFGSVTWWLFFDDGYRAMDALDDNRDGELAGDELAGLGIWTDANSNGVSDPGEVVPIAEAGIEAISCRQTDTTMGMPANLTGLRMTDGRVLPTYDWVATEIDKVEATGR